MSTTLGKLHKDCPTPCPLSRGEGDLMLALRASTAKV